MDSQETKKINLDEMLEKEATKKINMNEILKEEYREQKETKEENTRNPKKKNRWKKVLVVLFIITFILAILGSIFLFLFFKTGLFQEYKELWVETAMTTMNHQYLATWFLSDDEINEIFVDTNSFSENQFSVFIKYISKKK